MMEEDQRYTVLREGEDIILRIDCEKASIHPSIEDSALCMSTVIDLLVENRDATKIVLYEKRDYEYDFGQTLLLVEIAQIFTSVVKERDMLSYYGLGSSDQIYNEIKNILFQTLKTDPLGAYVELHRILRREKITRENTENPQIMRLIDRYIALLTKVLSMLEQAKLIAVAKPYLAGFAMGRENLTGAFFILR